MRFVLLPLLISLLGSTLVAQTSLVEIDLENGSYAVGFQHSVRVDSTRTYNRFYEFTRKSVPRPIPISIWYPAVKDKDTSEFLKVVDYLEILKEEEEWEHLPNEQILNWFYYANTPENQAHLKEQTSAVGDAAFAKGKFPVVVYAPSFQASSIENFALCEYLASHGFIVLSSPSRGTETRWFSNNYPREMETQARDVEFLIREAGKYPAADYDKIAIMGFSFGGLSNIIVQNRNDQVKAIASLDGTERYQYQLLEKSPFFDPLQLRVPYIHMAQKEIPENVLKEDGIDEELNTKFMLYDSITRSEVYRLRFNNLTHSHFSTLGVLFSERDRRQDKSDPEIMESYRTAAVYTLNFLEAALNKDNYATQFIRNQPADNGISPGLLSHRMKRPIKEAFTFADFNDLAAKRDYKALPELYDSIVKKEPSFGIPEGNLNTLGLQLVFNPETASQGINVFLLGIEVYPDSANLYDSLAEGYLHNQDKANAIKCFEKSLELNPGNQNAINRLEQLKE